METYFIIRFFKFSLFAVVIYVGLILVWDNAIDNPILKPNLPYDLAVGGYTSERLSEAKSIGEVDILFAGSSHAYRGFDTREFAEQGIESFNLGSSSQTPLQTEVLLRRYSDSLDPELVILDVYPVTLSMEGVESAADIISNDTIDNHTYNMAFEINDIRVYNTLICGSIYELLGMHPLNSIHDDSDSGANESADTYVSGGYVERSLEHYEPDSLTPEFIELEPDQLDALKRIVEYLSSEGIEAILVYVPIPSANYERYQNNEAFDSIMASIGEYYNFNELMTLDDSLHFFDDDHLNQLGVERFNRKLMSVVLKER